jgi:predicted flap endonuclease-1-like 5' DNA nuclease
MTQTLETQMERQLNLDYYYEAAKQAMSTKDYGQALLLAKKGLTEAQDVKHQQWIKTYSEFITSISKLQKNGKVKVNGTESIQNKKTIEENDLTEIKGIGSKVQESLIEQGIQTIQTLAGKTIEQLSEINGIGPTSAKKMLNNAKDYLQEKKRPKELISETQGESKNQGKESLKAKPAHEKFAFIDKKDLKEKTKPKKEEGISNMDSSKRVKASRAKISLPAFDQNSEAKTKIKKNQKEKKRSTSKLDIEKSFSIKKIKISSEMEKILSLLGYEVIISRKDSLKNYPETDLFAFREINMAKNFTALVIHPIRQLKLKNKMKMTSSNQSIVESISQIRSKIKDDISEEGTFFHYIKETYFPNLRIKKTLLKRPLFLIAGKVELSIIIEPIILSSENIGILEKNNSFSFSKDHALYYSTKEKIDDLLLYLRAKYKILQKINDEETSIEKYVEASQTFNKLLQYISVPFLMLGIFFSFLLVGSIDEFLLSSLFYPSITLYCMLLSYSYLKYKKEIKTIHRKFHSNPYDSTLEIDRKTLTRLTLELEKPHLNQFLFEFEEKNKKDTRKEGIKKEEDTSNHEMKEYTEKKPLKQKPPKENPEEIKKEKEITKNGLMKEVLNGFSFFMED